MLSLDIETDPEARRLLSVALFGCGASEVLLLTPPGSACPDGARAVPRPRSDAARRLSPSASASWTRTSSPGWNVIDFDLAVLLTGWRRRHGVPLELGRGRGAAAPARLGTGTLGRDQAPVPGRVVLDGIHLLRGAFVRMEDYALDAWRAQVLGEGKTLSRADRAEEILRLFEDDRERFVEYNRTDARLVLEILERLAPRGARRGAQPPDRDAPSTASRPRSPPSTSSTSPALAEALIVAPSVRADGRDHRAAGRRPRPRAPPRALPRTSWCSTSRACTRASSAPSRSTRSEPASRPEAGRRPDPDRRPERRRLRAAQPGILPRDPRRPVAAARGGAPRRRHGQEPRHQDPDELVLRRPRDAGLPLPRRAAGQRHHQLRPGDPAVVPGADRGGGSPRALRRHRQPVRRVRARRTQGRRAPSARRLAADLNRGSVPARRATAGA